MNDKLIIADDRGIGELLRGVRWERRLTEKSLAKKLQDAYPKALPRLGFAAILYGGGGAYHSGTAYVSRNVRRRSPQDRKTHHLDGHGPVIAGYREGAADEIDLGWDREGA